MSDHHAHRAFELLAQLPHTPHQLDGQLAIASAATAHALLAIEARLGELVEQQRIANVIAAFGTDGEDGLIDPADQADAEIYVRGAIHRILNHTDSRTK